MLTCFARSKGSQRSYSFLPQSASGWVMSSGSPRIPQDQRSMPWQWVDSGWGSKVLTWGNCGPHRGIFQGTAWVVCSIFALIATPIEGRITPNQELDSVVELKYCETMLPRIEIHTYLQQRDTKTQIGTRSVRMFLLSELNSYIPQETEP